MKKQAYVGYQVHGYREGNDTIHMRGERVTRVVALGNHCYDGTQHETAIKAATNGHPRARWYVGYGGDYIPANKTDIANIVVEQ